MITYRRWIRRGKRVRNVEWEGYFLFGFIPLYVQQLTLDA
jgi:hypothetical protein